MILILNTGGTLTKRYDPLAGELIVPQEESGLESLLVPLAHLPARLEGVVHKDSLQMDATDRAAIIEAVRQAPEARILIVHGTDTMHLTAQALEAAGLQKRIVLTGAMVPASIDRLEAALHLGMALGFLCASENPGIFVTMHGLILPHARIEKNRIIGLFEEKS